MNHASTTELSAPTCSHYPGYRMPLVVVRDAVFERRAGDGERFSPLVVRAGRGSVLLNDAPYPIDGATLICLNERDVLAPLEPVAELDATRVYFHPTLVNARFELKTIQEPASAFSVTDGQDLFCLRPFVRAEQGGEAGRDAFVPIGPATARRIALDVDEIERGVGEQGDPGWPCRTRARFIQLLYLVEQLSADAPRAKEETASDLPPAMQRLLLYLQTNYHEKITIERLTREFNTNRTTLAQAFRRHTGRSLHDYLTRLRLQVAAMLLRDTLVPIGDIMQRVGYADPTHFARVFRAYAQCSPSQYRNRYCWMIRRDE